MTVSSLLIVILSAVLPILSLCLDWKCLDGYRLADDNFTCIDIDECFDGGLGICGQICTNLPGSYTCSCLAGYTLEDNKWSCHPDSPPPYLIFSHGNAIYKIDREGTNHQRIVTNSGLSVLLDFHYRNGKIYWADTENGLLQQAFINGTNRKTVRAVGKGLLGFAVDWLHNTIIWTNQKKGTIEMSNLHGKNSKVLLKDLIFPTVMAVDPEEGYMFWASEGSVPSIHRANLNATRAISIVKSMTKVKTLTLDLIDKRLFWFQSDAENISSSIRSCDYTGGSVQIIKQSMHHWPFGLSLFAEHVYYSDWKTSTIRRANKYTGKDIVVISPTRSFLPPADLKVVHPFCQPEAESGSQLSENDAGSICKKSLEGKHCKCEDGYVLSDDQKSCKDVNECAFWNHGCTLGCENVPGSYHCFCPKGFVLQPDMKTCQDLTPCLENYTECSHDCTQTSKGPICICPPGSVLGSDGKTCSGCMTPDNGGCSQICVPQGPVSWKCECLPGYNLELDGQHCHASGPRPFLLFANGHDIRRINFDGTDYHIVLEGQMGRVLALDYDPVQSKVYFAHTGLKEIEIANLDGSEREKLISNDVDLPEGLAVDWINRKLYWIDRGLSHIARSGLNGTHREVIVHEGVNKPRGIAVHPLVKRLFWTACGNGPRIESSSLEGGDRLVIIGNNLVWPSGVTIDYLSDKLYWCDAKRFVIETSDLHGYNRRILAQNEVGRPFDVAVFEDHVWFTDWSKPSLMRVDKWTGHNRVRLRGGMRRPSSISVVHPVAKPGADPCLYKNGGCGQVCENRLGVARCLCRNGFQKTADGKSCQLVNVSTTVDPRITFSAKVNLFSTPGLQDENLSPSEGSSSTTSFNEDKITPELQPRSTLVAEIMVSDQDDCGTSECDLNALCIVSEGIARCQCLEGFTGQGNICNDIDECKTGVHRCNENAVCTNTDGNYTCTCYKGFIGTGYYCLRANSSVVPTEGSIEATTRDTTSETTTHMQENHMVNCPRSHEGFCLNGGICFLITEITSMSCNCPKGYMGERCEYSDLQWWELHRVEEEKRRNVVIAVCMMVLICLLSVGACVTYCIRHQKRLKKSHYQEEMSQTSSSSIDNVTETSTNSEQQSFTAVEPNWKFGDASIVHIIAVETHDHAAESECAIPAACHDGAGCHLKEMKSQCLHQQLPHDHMKETATYPRSLPTRSPLPP
ncbi:pro-epidermal growth factor isoform X2 [Pristis pectinata]|uniref:pro-epidermal growth factor isoform X2 n=1 Tax=Pristis pectinata TaxID=685728 RepID=UPI00223DCF7E|nr:pro-epidermal growth factor isoform X2 [Pristis pectinata]